MKKTIIIILSAVLYSCTQISIVIIDGCEYIETESITGHGSVKSLAHKGNCKNPIHFAQIKKDTSIVLPLIQKPLK